MMKVIFAALLLIYNQPIRLVLGEPIRAKRDLAYENSVCVCVPYYQCTNKGSMNEDGEGIIDIRAGSPDSPTSKRKACDHYLSVCCLPTNMKTPGANGQQTPGQGSSGQQVPTQDPNGQVIPNKSPISTGPAGQSNQSPGVGGQNQQTGGGVNGKNHVSKGCGYRNSKGVGFRITGNNNNEANFGEFPWMLAILHQKKVNGNLTKVYKCGGSLIHRRVALTGAHCAHGLKAGDLFVRAGEWDTQTVNEPLPHQDRGVTIIAIHPQFKPTSLWYNYALLILDKPVDLADNVELACLPDANEVFTNSKCITTGWGKNVFGAAGKYQVILKAVELPIVPNDKCQENLRKTRLGDYFKLHESFICAGGIKGVDACTGDGGSPLVCPLPKDPTRYAQVGTVSWGIGCGEQDVPGVYADVAKGRQWIDKALSAYHIDSVSYSPGGNNNYPPA